YSADQCQPNICHLRVYGATAYIYINNRKQRPKGRKILAKAVVRKLYGYESLTRKVYKIRLNNGGKIIRTRNAKFIEERHPLNP
ncbi:hypothetical protein QBC32DRAFT_176819, partial [Pseudoneurospora amorphoporcata]